MANRTLTQFPIGAQTYRIAFDYLSRSFVVVSLLSSVDPTINKVLTPGNDYTYQSSTTIKITASQAGYDIVQIHRFTSVDLLVSFQDGAVLTAGDLTNSELQAIHIAEEGRDQSTGLAKQYADQAITASNEAQDVLSKVISLALSGYIPVGSFEGGGTVRVQNEVLQYGSGPNTTHWRWDGPLPKVVTAGSSPITSGGVGKGAWVDVTDATLRSSLFTNPKYIPWTTPLAWPTLKDCFESPFETIVVPKGVYPISSTVKSNIVGNKRIVCEPGAVFRLNDNVRKHVMTFVGDTTNTFEWSGGEIDGNWEGQGPETMTNGYINDVSHGITTSKFRVAHLHDFYIHDCMGHHINHGGNTLFIAERIRIRAHPSALKPLGGARGDGITGCSANVVIRDISGFSTDDFIAVVSGIDWIDGWYPNRMSVESILIENIRCETYKFEGVDRYCHTAVSVGNSIGYQTKGRVVIRNVSGTVVTRGIGYTAESYGPDYYGSFEDNALIEGINLQVVGDPANGFTGRKNTAHIVIGCEGFNTESSSRNNYCKTVTLRNITCRGSAYCGTGIILGHMSARAVQIEDMKITYENATDNMVALMIVGQKDIGPVTIENVYQQVVGASTDAVRATKKVIESYYGGAGALTINGRNLTKQPNVASTGYLPNCSSQAATGFSKTNPRLYGKDLMWELDHPSTGGVQGLPLVDGMNFSTPGLGHISYSRLKGGWTFHEFAVQWDANNFGKPTASNFPNFSQFRWLAGSVIPVKGSPLQECQGYVCTSSGPEFDLVSNSFNTSSSVLQSSSWTPLTTKVTPGTRITSVVPSSSTDAGWPSTGGAVVETYIGSNPSNFFNTFQEWRSGNTRKVRYWGGTTWGGWS